MITKIKTYIESKFDGLYSNIASHVTERTNILQVEVGEISKKFTDTVEASIASQKQLYEKVVQLEEDVLALEREKQSMEDVAEDANREYEEVNEKWESLSEEHRELEEAFESANERISEHAEHIGKFSAENTKLATTIASLEHEVQSAKVVVKSLTERNVETQTKQERLLTLAKEYDKATVSLLNAVLERKPATEERKVWEAAKAALKGWDTPPVPKKGRKKQS